MSLLSALLQVLPFPIADPVPLWRRVCCWVCVTPLLWALIHRKPDGHRLTPREAALVSYLCGFLWYLGNCYWIFPTMHTYGNIASPVAFGILILFSLYVGLYHALFGAVIGWLNKAYSEHSVLWLSPIVWVAVELARARITGFPWDLLGYTQVDNLTLTRLAPWTGAFGLSLVIALVNALWLVRLQVRSRRVERWGIGLAATASVALTVAAVRRAAAASPTDATAVLLQENLRVGAEATGPPESRADMLTAFSTLSLHPSMETPNPAGAPLSAPAKSKPDLLVWPEAPADFFDGEPNFRASLGALALRADAPVIADSITIAKRSDEGRLLQAYNSASFFSADGRHVGRYDKMHLVPFGEYVPYKPIFFFAGHLLDDVGPFIPGQSRELFTTGGHRYGVFICYESIFGDEIREFARAGADVLVNISDDGWYGDSSAPWEHLDMVRMRAIENHRWVLRATNTGVTGAIDPYGRVVAEMPRHVRGSIVVPFAYETEQTFYTRHGDWLAWLCAGITMGAFAVGMLRKREVH